MLCTIVFLDLKTVKRTLNHIHNKYKLHAEDVDIELPASTHEALLRKNSFNTAHGTNDADF